MPPWWWGGKLQIMISSLFSPHFPLSSSAVLAHLISPCDFIENCNLTFLCSRLTRGFYLVVNHLRSCWYILSLYSPHTHMPIYTGYGSCAVEQFPFRNKWSFLSCIIAVPGLSRFASDPYVNQLFLTLQMLWLDLQLTHSYLLALWLTLLALTNIWS